MSEDEGGENGENENGGRPLDGATGGLDQTPTGLSLANGGKGSSGGLWLYILGVGILLTIGILLIVFGMT